MAAVDEGVQDVMQVCRNGHVITDRLRQDPGSGLAHCDRCGAATLDRCPTCGQQIPGALVVPGLAPVGVRPPLYCSMCGAAFPWHEPAPTTDSEQLARLEALLRRVPLVVRQLRVRHGCRPPFRIEDVFDLEDLLRALLPIHFDDIRPRVRTPRYAPAPRTDFLLAAEKIVVACKLVRPEGRERELAEQVAEDSAHYSAQPEACGTLVVFLHDPERLLREPRLLTPDRLRRQAVVEVRCIVAPAG